MRPTAIVRYRYRRSGSNTAWTSSTWSGQVLQTSEVLVLQALRKAKPGSEIELTELRWL